MQKELDPNGQYPDVQLNKENIEKIFDDLFEQYSKIIDGLSHEADKNKRETSSMNNDRVIFLLNTNHEKVIKTPKGCEYF